MKTTASTLIRDDYGSLRVGNANDADRAIYACAAAMVVAASKRKKIRAAYENITCDRKGRFSGDAIHHEIYDIAPNGKSVLICVRRAEGSKYGVRTTYKSYFLITVCGRGVKVADADKSVAAKAAKAARVNATLGAAIRAGKIKIVHQGGLS